MEQQLSLEGYLDISEKEEVKEVNNMAGVERITGTKAMQITELSRHSFEKVVKEDLLIPHIDGKKKYYLMDEIQKFMTTERYKELSESIVDPRNPLNDLTWKDWLPETESFVERRSDIQ